MLVAINMSVSLVVCFLLLSLWFVVVTVYCHCLLLLWSLSAVIGCLYCVLLLLLLLLLWLWSLLLWFSGYLVSLVVVVVCGYLIGCVCC